MKQTELSMPWHDKHFYLINSVKYAYETEAGLDFIWLYDGMGKIYVKDVEAQGYQVTKPKLKRNHIV